MKLLILSIAAITTIALTACETDGGATTGSGRGPHTSGAVGNAGGATSGTIKAPDANR